MGCLEVSLNLIVPPDGSFIRIRLELVRVSGLPKHTSRRFRFALVSVGRKFQKATRHSLISRTPVGPTLPRPDEVRTP